MQHPHRPDDELTGQLTQLHDEYVDRVNRAVAEDDQARAHELAAAYDDHALRLIVGCAGEPSATTPSRRSSTSSTPLRRLARRLHRAA